MADSYICSGANLQCSSGASPSLLVVPPSSTVLLCGQPPMANVMDDKPGVNFIEPYFVSCMASGIPTKCVPVVENPWQMGKLDYCVRGQFALLKSSFCICKRGGVITLMDDGQKAENPWTEKEKKSDSIAKKPDKIIITDAYWEKILEKNGKKQDTATKIRFLPQLEEAVQLTIVFYYENDDDNLFDKSKATIEIEIPGTCLEDHSYSFTPEKRKPTGKKAQGKDIYKVTLDGFSFDLINYAK